MPRPLNPNMPPNDYVTEWTNLSDDELTVDLITETLEPIRDDLWVTVACVDRLVENVDAQRALLEIGIKRTRAAVGRSQEAESATTCLKLGEGGEEDNESEEEKVRLVHQVDSLVAHFRGVPVDAQLCHIRAVLLERLDRLNTFVEVRKELPEREVNSEGTTDEWEEDPWAGEDAEDSTESDSNSSFNVKELPVSLPDFLTRGLVHIACTFASQESFGALRILFQRHGVYLWAYRFHVLESVPEHAKPSEYLYILLVFNASIDMEQEFDDDPWRQEPDWTEQLKIQAAIRVAEVPLGVEFSSEHNLLELHSEHEHLSAAALAKWYESRVDKIITATGLIDVALSTVQHGASQGLPGLDALGEELSLLSKLVYDAPKGDDLDDEDDWTLGRWRTMSPSAVIRAYLKHSTPGTLVKDMNRLVLPYLFVLESKAERAGKPDPDLPKRLLYDFLLSTSLEMAAVIFEASKPTLPQAQRLIKNDEEVARLALACLYGSNSLDEWPTMSRIFECMPAWNIEDNSADEEAADTTILSLGAYVTPSTSQPSSSAADLLAFFKPLPIASLSRALDILDVHLESGEIFSRWSVPAPLRWFLQSHNDVATQRAWAKRLARRAGGEADKLNTVDDWQWLLDDMIKLCGTSESGLKGALGLISKDEIVHIFFGGLLSTGKFPIAKDLLKSSKSRVGLNPAAIEEICLASSREFYDNASSGNYKFGEMKLAYDCLDVPPLSEKVTNEKEFIEATSRLASFNLTSRPGIPISPIEIRLAKDRLSLVSQVLSSNADAYKHTQVILELVQKLGFRDDIVAEVKTLAMLVDSALQSGDFPRAYESSERMVQTVSELRMNRDDPKIQESSEVCWVACFQLGRHPEFEDVEKKMSLLGHALELCPPEKIQDVLTAWHRLEKEDIEARQERINDFKNGVTSPAPRKQTSGLTSAGISLAAKLQDFRMPSAPLLSTPDAAALASRTFSRVAANLPFSVGNLARSAATDSEAYSRSDSGGGLVSEVGDVQAQASRVLQKGIGWLIGADED